MKILYCQACGDLFKLTRTEVRSCKCNKVRGKYLNNRYAKFSQNVNTISIKIDNDSLKAAIERMRWWERHRAESTSEDYKNLSSLDAWVRPNSPPGNPHSNKPNSRPKNKIGKRKV
jgi:hypothetical protein